MLSLARDARRLEVGRPGLGLDRRDCSAPSPPHEKITGPHVGTPTMQAYASVRGPDGSTHELVHGDLIGRLVTSAMPLDDARISEAHAMVSLREGELRLIALRGAMAVDGRRVGEVAMTPGLEITLARGVGLEVLDVPLPSHVLGIEGPGIPRQLLPPVASVLTQPLRLVAGHVDAAAAWLWHTGSSWRVRRADGSLHALEAGTELELDGERLHVLALPLQQAGLPRTRAAAGSLAPLRLIASFDTVQIHRDDGAPLVLGGTQARVVSELVALGGPAAWRIVADLIWPDEDDADVLRSRFDVTISRLRRKLKECRIRTDLVHTDGSGQIELLLYPGDHVDDRT